MSPRTRTAPRKLPRQPRALATVDSILTATARVLVKDGYDRASTNRIARAAGVSVGSLYQYFPSKEALVAALIERHFDRCMATLEAKFLELASAPPEVVARAIIEVMVEMKLLDPALERVLLEQVPRVGRLAKMRELDDRMARLIQMYLASRRAELRELDPEAAAFVLVKTGAALAHAIAIERPSSVSLELLTEEFKQLVLRYLAPAEAARVESTRRRPAVGALA